MPLPTVPSAALALRTLLSATPLNALCAHLQIFPEAQDAPGACEEDWGRLTDFPGARNGQGVPSAIFDARAELTPLSGLHAALAWAPRELVFCCAVDMPFAADDGLLDALFAAIQGHAAAAPVHAGVVQPLCALYRSSACLALAEQFLPAGPRALIERVDAALVAWEDPRPFLDADTAEALRALERA